MSRREFSKLVKRDAFLRADGKCEGANCGAKLTKGKFAYDHDIADGLGGEPTLDNCVVLCSACHGVKTAKHDIPLIAKIKRIQDREKGIRKPSRGFYDKKLYKAKIGGGLVLRSTGLPRNHKATGA
jgi:5-methylcytosine-specific restriction protein A